MKVALVVLLAVMAPVLVVAQEKAEEKVAPSEIEKQFTKGRIAEKEGRYAAADEVYRALVEKWPDDEEFTPKAMLHRVACQANMGKLEEAREIARLVTVRYKRIPKVAEAAKAVLAKLPERVPVRELRTPEPPKEVAQKAVRAVRLEELRRVWTEQGVEEEEIDRRIEKIRAEFEARKAEHRRLEEEAKRLEAEGLTHEEAMRRIEEARRERDRLEDARFRNRHDRGMREAREEFLRLAERLGIPPEEAERFLDQHRRGGPERQFRRIRHFEEAIEHVQRAVKEAHERQEHVERAIEHIERSLEDRGEEGEHAFRRLHRHVEELTERLERMEAKIERAHEDLVPHLEEMMERIEELEERLEDEGDTEE